MWNDNEFPISRFPDSYQAHLKLVSEYLCQSHGLLRLYAVVLPLGEKVRYNNEATAFQGEFV